MGIACYMVRPTARFMYWHQSTKARISQMAIRSAQHKRSRTAIFARRGESKGQKVRCGSKADVTDAWL